MVTHSALENTNGRTKEDVHKIIEEFKDIGKTHKFVIQKYFLSEIQLITKYINFQKSLITAVHKLLFQILDSIQSTNIRIDVQ